MNRHLLTICLVATFFAARAYATTPYFAESYGVAAYDTQGRPTTEIFSGSGGDYPRAIAPMPDGGMVVAGQIAFPRLSYHSGAYNSDAVVVRFAADGSIVWQTELRQTNSVTNGQYNHAGSVIQKMKTDPQGNVFVAGTKGNPSNGGAFPFVAKFSPAGQLLWQKGIPLVRIIDGQPPQTTDVGMAGANIQMSLTNEGGVLFSSDQGRPPYYTAPALVKFNADGALGFYKMLDTAGASYQTPLVAQTTDGSKYLAARNYPLTTGPGGVPLNGLAVAAIDANTGQIVADRGWGPLSSSNNETSVVGFIRTADGGFASLSRIEPGQGFVFRKLNSDASATTIERIIKIANGTPGFFIGSDWGGDVGSFSQTADGGFLISGSSNYPNTTSGQDAAMMKLKPDGTVEWVSLLGGPENEAYFSVYLQGCVATQLSDGVYGLAVSSGSYRTDPSGDAGRHKPDWWLVRTNAARQVPGFTGTMVDLPPSYYTVGGAPQAPVSVSAYSNSPFTSVSPLPSTAPTFILQDVGKLSTPDVPSLVIQASSPRILSGLTAEAYVTRHFSYHILCSFFPANSTLTFSATGLPANFTINPATGVISGVAGDGSQTTTPIPIGLAVTNGTDTATATLQLTISDGAPTFTVNGSDQPAYPGSGPAVTDQVDKVLTFNARQPGYPAGRAIIVEATTTPDVAGSWQHLTNGTNGFMPFDQDSSKDSASYVLGTTQYPHVNGVYFRAHTTTPDRPDDISNVVGPFNLASSAQRLGKTNLFVTHNGLGANIRWGVTEETLVPNIAVRIQATKTPSLEGSWLDIANGQMTQDTTTPAPNEFYLGTDSYPLDSGVYFRAVASASGYIDSISALNGPYTFINDPPATVTLNIPGVTGTNGQDFDFPITPQSSSFNVSASANSARQIVSLDLIYDSDTLEHFGGASGQTLYTTTTAGDHLIEAVAKDDLGVIGDARPVHVRIAPPLPGKIFYITTSGNWGDPNIWIDGNGNHAVPGVNDFAVLSNVDVTLTSSVQVRALSMNGATIKYSGAKPKLTVTGWFTIGGGGILCDVDIADGATLLMINDTDLQLGGLITNSGRMKVHGRGGITGVPSASGAFNRIAADGSVNPDGFFDFVGALWNKAVAVFSRPAGGRNGSSKPGPTPTPAPSAPPVRETRQIAVASVLNSVGAKLVAQGGGNLVAQGGGNIVAQGGGNLVAQGGGNATAKTPIGLVDRNGNPIVAQGGGNLVAQGGGNLVAQGGGNLVAQGGGNLVAQGGGNLVAQGGGNIVAQGGGNLVAQGGGNFRQLAANGGVAASMDLPTDSGALFTVEGGEVDMTAFNFVGGVQVNGGLVKGNGIVVGDINNAGGVIAPGDSSGVVGVTGSFSQGSNGTLLIRATGGEANQFDRIESGGTANLGGNLKVYTFNNYTPLANDAFAPVAFNGVTGSFNANTQSTITPDGAVAALPPAQVPPPALQVSTVKSRKTHNDAGTFDVNLGLNGSGIDPRFGGAAGNFTVVFTLTNPLTSVDHAVVVSGAASLVSAGIGANPQEYVVELTGVTNAQTVGLSLANLKDTFDQSSSSAAGFLSVLLGDANGDGVVNSGDATVVRNRSGNPTDASNFRADVTADGVINSGDATAVRNRSGTSLGSAPATSVRKDPPQAVNEQQQR